MPKRDNPAFFEQLPGYKVAPTHKIMKEDSTGIEAAKNVDVERIVKNQRQTNNINA